MEAKLSMWSSYYIDLNPYEMVLELEKNGYEYSELSDEHGLTLLNENDDEVLTGKRFKDFRVFGKRAKQYSKAIICCSS